MAISLNSLKARLFLAATLILVAFVVLTGVALSHAFRVRAEQAEVDRLSGLIYAVLGATDSDRKGGLRVKEAELRDDRLIRPDSGLYAVILNSKGDIVWQSKSVFDPIEAGALPKPGQWSFSLTRTDAGQALFARSFTVRWSTAKDPLRNYTFVAAESTEDFTGQMNSFSRALWLWLLVPAAMLLALQLIILQWGLAPLRRLVGDLRAIETGRQAEIGGVYPDELKPLTQALNAMLRNERNQQTRYRHALDDLAHSLKTPLAVLSGDVEREGVPPEQRARLREQLERMRQIIGYQLKKAAAAGSRRFTSPIRVRPVAEKLTTALGKVYRDKQIRYRIDIPEQMAIRMDEGDLMEMTGNLLDNASKWCRKEVRITGRLQAGRLVLDVEDDGAGFPGQDIDELLKRGVRADMRIEGQGIGLAVVAEIVRACDGSVRLGKSALGGASVNVELPAL